MFVADITSTLITGLGLVHSAPKEFENVTMDGHFGFVFEKISVREITCLVGCHSNKRLRSQNVFRSRKNKSLGLKFLWSEDGLRTTLIS